MRLHELTKKQINDWQDARMEMGQERYGEDHLERYLTIDMMEEILDALNIIILLKDQMTMNYSAEEEIRKSNIFYSLCYDIEDLLYEVIERIMRLDRKLDDRFRCDEKGGNRVWWSERKKVNEVLSEILNAISDTKVSRRQNNGH